MSSARSGAPITGIAGEPSQLVSIANSCYPQPPRTAVADSRHNQDGVSENLPDSYQTAADTCEKPEGLQATEAAQRLLHAGRTSTAPRMNLAAHPCTMQRRRGRTTNFFIAGQWGGPKFRGFLWHDAASPGLPQWASRRGSPAFDAGANVQATNKAGATALHEALRWRGMRER